MRRQRIPEIQEGGYGKNGDIERREGQSSRVSSARRGCSSDGAGPRVRPEKEAGFSRMAGRGFNRSDSILWFICFCMIIWSMF
jgi:hypothetical protein